MEDSETHAAYHRFLNISKKVKGKTMVSSHSIAPSSLRICGKVGKYPHRKFNGISLSV